MLVAGGKTSTLTQFTELARQAGLDVIAARTQSSGRFVVECRPNVTHRPNLKRQGFSFRRNPRGKAASHPVVTV